MRERCVWLCLFFKDKQMLAMKQKQNDTNLSFNVLTEKSLKRCDMTVDIIGCGYFAS